MEWLNTLPGNRQGGKEVATKVGINGFGRIGRLALKAINERHDDVLSVVAVNDLTDARTNAHLFKYDSNYGVYPGKVEARDSSILIDGNEIRVLAERDPAQISWGGTTEWISSLSQRDCSLRPPRLLLTSKVGPGRWSSQHRLGTRT